MRYADTMEKREAMMLVAALVVIIVIAVIFKPMLTGKQANLQVPFLPAEPTPTFVPTTLPPSTPSPAAIPPTPIPSTPPPTWGGKPADLKLANQSGYSSRDRPFPESYANVPAKMATYVSIKGKTGGTTDTFHMPFPYWEIQYTVEPTVKSPAGGISEISKDLVTASSLHPFFEIDVYDAKNTAQPIRKILPEGGLDTELWKDAPPVWVEKFYEGSGDYYFVITAQSLSGYAVMVKVPEKYIGT